MSEARNPVSETNEQQHVVINRKVEKMKDRDFLIWLHARLTDVHGESECFDYMHKLRAIIKATDSEKITPNIGTKNSLEDLCRDLGL